MPDDFKTSVRANPTVAANIAAVLVNEAAAILSEISDEVQGPPGMMMAFKGARFAVSLAPLPADEAAQPPPPSGGEVGKANRPPAPPAPKAPHASDDMYMAECRKIDAFLDGVDPDEGHIDESPSDRVKRVFAFYAGR